MSAQAGSGSGLTVETGHFADCRVVTVEGRIDHMNADHFLELLTAETRGIGKGGLVVDLGRLQFITSAGLRALLIAHRSVETGGGRMIVTGLDGVVAEVFRIAKFDELVEIAASVDEAMARQSDAARAAWSG